MSSFLQAGPVNPLIIRYRRMNCDCRRAAMIKVSGTQRHPNYLFYTCKDGECDFFKWCEAPEETNELVSPFTGETHGEDVLAEVNFALQNVKDRFDSAMLVWKATLVGLIIVIFLLLILLLVK